MGVVFAQELSGSGLAGWTTFGLAGLILAWLFLKYLPDKDKQLKDMLTAHQGVVSDKDKQLRELLTAHQIVMTDKDAQMEKKDGQIERMLAAKNEQMKILTESGTAQIRTMVEANGSQARLMHDENKVALERVIRHCEEEVKAGHQLLQQSVEQISKVVDELVDEIRLIREDRLSHPTRVRVRRQPPNQPPLQPPKDT
jgi:hypothetical protein